MKRRYWRLSRPVGSLVCVLLLLLLAWYIRLAEGLPLGSPETQLRRLERRLLQSPGELVEIYEARYNAANVVTWRDGEPTVYYFLSAPDSSDKKWKHRYHDGIPLHSAQPEFSWGCCTSMFIELNAMKENSLVDLHWFCVLVKNQDPRVSRGVLTVEARNEEFARRWTAEAERTNPYYLSFRLETQDKGKKTFNLFSAVCNGESGDWAEAKAEAVFYDADGNEVNRMTFDMIDQSIASQESVVLPEITVGSQYGISGERSQENGA